MEGKGSTQNSEVDDDDDDDKGVDREDVKWNGCGLMVIEGGERRVFVGLRGQKALRTMFIGTRLRHYEKGPFIGFQFLIFFSLKSCHPNNIKIRRRLI